MDALLQIAQQRGSDAHKLYHQGKYQESLELYRQQLEKDPKDELNLMGVADCLLALKKYKEAKAEYEDILESGSNKHKSHLLCNYAWCLSKMGEDNDDAIDSLMNLAMKTQEGDSDCIQVLTMIADHFLTKLQLKEENMSEEEIENALKTVRKCVDKIDEIDPIYSDGLLVKGNYYSFISADTAAVDTYNEFVELFPDDYRGYYNLGHQMAARKMYQQAIGLYLKSDSVNKENKNFALKLAFKSAVKAGNIDLVLTIMQKKLAEQPKSPEVYQETVTACLLMSKFNAGIMIAQNWTNDCPENVMAWQFLAELTYQFKNYEVSEKAYTTLNKLTNYTDHSAINVLGAIHLVRKDYDKTFEYCLKSLEVKYDYAFAFRNLSEFRKDYPKEKFYQFYDDYTSKYPINEAAKEYLNRIKDSFPEDVEYLNQKFKENENTVKAPQKIEAKKEQEGCCGGHDHHHH